MSASVEKVFLDALEDLREGRADPVEHYLELVPQSERAQLADLLAMYFASRRRPAGKEVRAASYERALATIDRVSETAGPTGILPGLISELRRTRGLRRQEITRALCEHFELAADAAPELEREYHRLETGQLAGERLSRRLLSALADIFRMDTDELMSASVPLPERGPRSALAFGRRKGTTRGEHEAAPDQQLGVNPQVWQLFYGGRDA